MNEGKVAILMATYNGEKYIREQVHSIQLQTYTNWDLLVSDDGSSDATLSIISELADKDCRVRILPSMNETGTASGNFMGLIHRAQDYEYVFFCDQDDVWYSNKIEKELGVLRKTENNSSPGVPVLVFSDSRVVDQDLVPIRSSFVETLGFSAADIGFAQLAISNVAQGCTIGMNASLVSLLCRFDFNSDIGMHDWWAMILAMGFGTAAYIDEPTMDYRQHEKNVVGAVDSTMSSWLARIAKKPSSLSGWRNRAKADASDAIGFVRAVETQVGLEISPDKELILLDILQLPGAGLLGRVKTIFKYGLVNRGDPHKNLYWLYGLLFCRQ